MQLGALGRYKPPPPPAAGPRQSPGGGQGAQPLEALKILHLTAPKSGSKIDQQQVDGYAFLCALQ